MEIKDTGCDHY